MWRRYINCCTLVVLLACAVADVQAQPKNNSPLSRFGMGDLYDREFVSSHTMGGLGATYHHIFQANVKNPASYGHLEATTLDIGMFGRHTRLKRAGEESSIWSGNIEYFSLSIPLINPINELLEQREKEFTWGLNISLMPHSDVGYFVIAQDHVDSIGTVSRNFQGTGGTFRFNVGNGWKYRGLSAGVNLGYLFGKSEYLIETVFDSLFNNYEHIDLNSTAYEGFLWDIGVMYEFEMPETSRQNRQAFTVGLHYHTDLPISTTSDYLNYVENPFFNDRDTADFRIDASGKGTLPSEFGVGLMYEESTKWRAGVNFTSTPWSNYENESRPETLSDAWRVSVGGAYTPNASSITSFFERAEYRAGFTYAKDPRSIDGEQVTQIALTAGIGMPFVFQRYFSFVNIGLEYGSRGISGSFKENYIRVKLGLSLNDNQWFIKRRYN